MKIFALIDNSLVGDILIRYVTTEKDLNNDDFDDICKYYTDRGVTNISEIAKNLIDECNFKEMKIESSFTITNEIDYGDYDN